MQTINHLYGDAGTGKTTFMDFLAKISQGNTASMNLKNWNSHFGKSSALGASLLLFDDINTHGLTYTSANLFKQFVCGLRILVDRKKLSHQYLEGGAVVMSSNHRFTFEKAKNLVNDEGCCSFSRYLGVRIKRPHWNPFSAKVFKHP